MEDLISNNTRLVYKQLTQFHLLQDQDAESAGFEALYNAAVAYDDSRGVKFSTFATSCIYNALGTYLRQKLKKRQLKLVSYNNLTTMEDGNSSEYLDTLASVDSPEEDLIHSEQMKEVLECFRIAYKQLRSDKQKKVVDAWENLGWDASATDIAALAGCSQPYVSQVLATFKNSIRRTYYERDS